MPIRSGSRPPSGCGPCGWWPAQGFGYLGQALSSAEQVAALFSVARPGADRIVCSPGHYVIAFYAAAAEVGLIGDQALDSYGQDGSALEAIGTERSPLFDYVAGSLGQGLSAAAGLALSDRLRGRPARTSPWSATASWKKARCGRRRCSPPITGCRH